MAMQLSWDDTEDIGIELADKFPNQIRSKSALPTCIAWSWNYPASTTTQGLQRK
jgi:hypothetical protein